MRFPARHAWLAACIGAFPAAAGAQAAVSVRGVAWDSLRNAPLAGAFVSIVGVGRSTIADSRGRFQFDSVAPGSHTLAMQHDLLDSLGLPGVSTRAVVTDGRAEVRIAVPPFGAFWAAACAGPAPADSGIVYGSVRRAGSRAPVVGAVVELAWSDVGLDPARIITERRWRNETRTDSSGTYAICGLPPQAGLRMRASTDSAASGAIHLPWRDARVQRQDLLVSAAGELDSTAFGTIVGRVTTAGGAPLANARVLADDVPETRSRADGTLIIRGVPAGTRQVEVLAIGMLPYMTALEVTARDTARFAAELRKVTLLDVVTITGSERQKHNARAIDERRRMSVGRFVDSTYIGKMPLMSSVFRVMPGVEVRCASPSCAQFQVLVKALGRGHCTATLYVDGVREMESPRSGPDHSYLSMLRPEDIALVEVYSTLTVPAELMGSRLCGTVAVWTKRAFR